MPIELSKASDLPDTLTLSVPAQVNPDAPLIYDDKKRQFTSFSGQQTSAESKEVWDILAVIFNRQFSNRKFPPENNTIFDYASKMAFRENSLTNSQPSTTLTLKIFQCIYQHGLRASLKPPSPIQKPSSPKFPNS